MFGILDGIHPPLDVVADVGAMASLEDEQASCWTGAMSSLQGELLTGETVPAYVTASSSFHYQQQHHHQHQQQQQQQQ